MILLLVFVEAWISLTMHVKANKYLSQNWEAKSKPLVACTANWSVRPQEVNLIPQMPRKLLPIPFISQSQRMFLSRKKKKWLKTSKDYNFFTLWMNSHVSVRQTTWIKSKGQNVKLVSQSQVVEEAEEVEEEDSWGGVFFFKTSLSLSLWIVESWKRKKKQASHDVLDWSNFCHFFFFSFFHFLWSSQWSSYHMLWILDLVKFKPTAHLLLHMTD